MPADPSQLVPSLAMGCDCSCGIVWEHRIQSQLGAAEGCPLYCDVDPLKDLTITCTDPPGSNHVTMSPFASDMLGETECVRNDSDETCQLGDCAPGAAMTDDDVLGFAQDHLHDYDTGWVAGELDSVTVESEVVALAASYSTAAWALRQVAGFAAVRILWTETTLDEVGDPISVEEKSYTLPDGDWEMPAQTLAPPSRGSKTAHNFRIQLI